MTKSTSRSAKRREVAAFHEAGHTVINWKCRTRIRRASIKPDVEEGSLGHVLQRKLDSRFNPDLDDEYRVRRILEPRILSAYAGVLAEKRHTGRRHNWTGASGDMAAVSDYILRCLGGDHRESSRYGGWLRQRAGLMVDHLWPQIEAVAAALVEHETLSEGEIRAVILASYGLGIEGDL